MYVCVCVCYDTCIYVCFYPTCAGNHRKTPLTTVKLVHHANHTQRLQMSFYVIETLQVSSNPHHMFEVFEDHQWTNFHPGLQAN